MTKSPKPQKRLISSTIVPTEYYVEREADRQLAANVREMGRPGYVLVARQMGKTNLLIHAKRTLEGPSTRFVYVDLSVVSYSNERDCFRQIIDTAIDSHQDLFESIRDGIESKREQLRPPNSEHAAEVRTLLNASNVKLVVILDEIDSLVNTEFSDRIFAHIRSVYFSRINYPELGRLTYILSGVVEPNEIIKDKKISPFNIGEKIYLSDFSSKEVRDFLEKSGMPSDDDALFNRLQYWIGGNPRMLWDICSQLEDEVIFNGLIPDSSLVDSTIRRHYLTNFDHSPVDHIRELVRDNPDIRSAVWTLMAGSPDDLSDAMRTKLYLFGITKVNSSVDAPVIKNEVIRQALSLDWLKGVDSDYRTIYNQAEEQYERKRYDRAAKAYSEFLDACTLDDKLRPIASYQLGLCEYYLNNFSAALSAFSEAGVLSSADLSQRLSFFKAICNYHIGNFDESITLSEAALNARNVSNLRPRIQMNLASALLTRGGASDLERAEEILTSVREDLSEVSSEKYDLEESERLEILTVACANLGGLLRKKGNLSGAISVLAEALTSAQPNARSAIYVRLAQIEVDVSKRIQHLRMAVESYRSGDLALVDLHPEQPLAMSESLMLELIGRIVGDEVGDVLSPLYESLSQVAELSSRPKFDWLFEAGKIALADKRLEHSSLCFRLALSSADIDTISRFDCATWLLLVSSSPELESEYLELLANKDISSQFSILAMRNISEIAMRRLGESKWTEALDVVRKVSRFRSSVDNSLVRNYIGLDLIEMVCLEKLGNQSDLHSVASRALRLWETVDGNSHGGHLFFSEDDLLFARDLAQRHLSSRDRLFSNAPPREVVQGIGRNSKVRVRYRDGRTLECVKYKRIENDLKRGLCVIVE